MLVFEFLTHGQDLLTEFSGWGSIAEMYSSHVLFGYRGGPQGLFEKTNMHFKYLMDWS